MTENRKRQFDEIEPDHEVDQPDLSKADEPTTTYVDSAREQFNEEEPNKFSCKKCSETIKYCGNTTNLWNHLKIHHIHSAKKAPSESAKKTRTLFDLNFNRQSKPDETDMLYVEATAKCGVSFYAISQITRLRTTLNKVGGNPVSSPGAIRERVVKFGRRIIEEDKQRISKLVDAGQKFVLILDEWTSNDTRRFMNITLVLSKNKQLNLGLTRVTGSATADNLVVIMNRKLKQFGLNIERDIIGLVTDGAATMMKFGKTLRQFCYHQVKI